MSLCTVPKGLGHSDMFIDTNHEIIFKMWVKLKEKCYTVAPPSSSVWQNQPLLVIELSINNHIRRQNLIYYLISTCQSHKIFSGSEWGSQETTGHTNEPYKHHLFWNTLSLRMNMMKSPDGPPPLPPDTEWHSPNVTWHF